MRNPSSIPPRAKLDAIVVDEVQDLLPLQLLLFRDVAKDLSVGHLAGVPFSLSSVTVVIDCNMLRQDAEAAPQLSSEE